MALRIWLHEGHDGGDGVVALGLDFLGFSTWAESDADVIAKLPAKFAEYAAWRARHGVPISETAPRVEIVDRLVGNEILFPPVSYTHLRAHETPEHLVCRLLLE